MFPKSESVPPERRPIRGLGTIIASHGSRVAAVRFGNGYETLAHWPASAAESLPVLAPGVPVEVEFNPYDMTQARILPPGH